MANDMQIKWNASHTKATLSNGIKVKVKKGGKVGNIETVGNSVTLTGFENAKVKGTHKKEYIQIYDSKNMDVNLKGGADVIHAEGVYNSLFNFGSGDNINAGIYGENNEVLGKELEMLKKALHNEN